MIPYYSMVLHNSRTVDILGTISPTPPAPHNGKTFPGVNHSTEPLPVMANKIRKHL